eukprot:4864447-Ditylum_brightwellii.AAC.1
MQHPKVFCQYDIIIDLINKVALIPDLTDITPNTSNIENNDINEDQNTELPDIDVKLVSTPIPILLIELLHSLPFIFNTWQETFCHCILMLPENILHCKAI